MMVSKIAVMALVAIVAAPILLGYALNLNEVTVTDYKTNDDPVNVTQLLQNGTSYTTAAADFYQLNSKFYTSSDDYPAYPSYASTSKKTSLPIYTGTSSSTWNGENQFFTGFSEYLAMIKYSYSASSYINAEIYSSGVLVNTLTHIIYLHYIKSTDTIEYVVATGANSTYENSLTGGNYSGVRYVSVGGQTATRYNAAIYENNNGSFADISQGYYFIRYLSKQTGYRILLPDQTQSVLISINLDSITDPNYSNNIFGFTFTKTTTNGEVSWNASRYVSGYGTLWSQDLYYNPNVQNNTYQMLIKAPDEKKLSDDNNRPSPTWYQYHRYVEFRYTGSWSPIIGEANYYQKYDYDYWIYSRPSDSYVDNIPIECPASGRSLTVRVDAAQFQAFQYQTIENNTYQPSSLRDNPATTISNVQKAGTQLIFGGNTYNVSKGNITIGSHSISVDGLTFSSVPNASGTYDNKIGNTLVSTTADPSTIEFVGKWSASVSTQSMESYTYTKTEWTAGQFGWDGLDQNFLMVGLLTSLGAFIALGIYIRRTKANLWPLIIVCGGAALLFFCML